MGGALAYPEQLVFGTNGNLYVADTFDSRIDEYDTAGNLVRHYGSNGTGSGQFQFVYGDAVDPVTGDVYGTDYTGNRVEKLGPTGSALLTIGSGQFSNPVGIAIDPSGADIYVADTGNYRVVKYDSSGNFVWAIGYGVSDGATAAFQVCTSSCHAGIQGRNNGQFDHATGVTIDPATGNLFVADSSAAHVQEFAPDGSLLSVIGTFGAPFYNPSFLAIDGASGQFFISDASSGADTIDRFGDPPPASLSSPAISGTAADGRSLSVTTGSWESGYAPADPVTFAFQWLRCDAFGAGCAAIAGATGQTYVQSAADVGHQVAVTVTATDQAGQSTPVTAVAVGPVGAPPAPSSSSPPSIGGAAQAGQTLTATHGSWTSPDALTFSFQWELCDAAGSGCVNIAGATGSSLLLTAADVGHEVAVVVSATDSESQTGQATAPATGPVAATPSSGNSGAGGGGGTGGASAAQIAASLRGQLAPSGAGARIAAILRGGGYAATLKLLAGGRLTIGWYYLPRGAHLARSRQVKPVLVARGSAILGGPGTVQVRLRLTAAGRRLLARGGRPKLTAKATLQRSGQPPIVALATFTLRR
jgi:sugar lactone lactonase YvrE